MPEVSLSEGDTSELLTLDRFDSVSIHPTGGDIRFAENRSDARRGTLITEDDRRIELALQSNETFYAYAERVSPDVDQLTVEYRKQGFLDIVFPRAEVNVFDTTNYPNIGAVRESSPSYPISIDETWTIKEFTVFQLPSDKVIQYTSEDNETATFEPRRRAFSETRVEIDSVSITDPNGTGGQAHIFYAGEP